MNARITSLIVLMLLLSIHSLTLDAGEKDPPLVARPLLSFPNEAGKPLVVPAGSEHFLRIRYGEELEPTGFSAKLNGEDVTEYFHPEPRTSERMALQFNKGENVLEFEAWRVERRDLPKGALPENEYHRLEVIVQERGEEKKTFIGREPVVAPHKNQ